MVLILGIVLWAMIGTVIGRVLFVKRLGNSARYYMGRDKDHITWREKEELLETVDLTSAQTYGLWSPVMWPITLAFFVIQAPTPTERQTKRSKELDDLQNKLQEITDQFNLQLTPGE